MFVNFTSGPAADNLNVSTSTGTTCANESAFVLSLPGFGRVVFFATSTVCVVASVAVWPVAVLPVLSTTGISTTLVSVFVSIVPLVVVSLLGATAFGILKKECNVLGSSLKSCWPFVDPKNTHHAHASIIAPKILPSVCSHVVLRPCVAHAATQ